jgi:GNAT superfamily N-acetyltransferase
VTRTRPRDGDGDGFVYDNTPRMRLWNPLTDLPYPDGKIPETARKALGRSAPRRPAPAPPPQRFLNRPKRRAAGYRPPGRWSTPPTDQQVKDIFTVDLGDGIRTEVDVRRRPMNIKVAGRFVNDDGELVGYFDRLIDLTERRARFDELMLDEGYRGRGLGRRFFAETVDRLEAAGVERISVHATSRRVGETNGAYTWARAGYDWTPGTIGHLNVATALEARLGGDHDDLITDMVQRLRSAPRAVPFDPARLPDDFPIPNDVAMLGWTEGAETWPGRDALLGDVVWAGSLHLDPPSEPQLGVDDIGELPNPFVPGVDVPGDMGSSEVPTDIAFYEVGGAVRDDVMGIPTDDVDFAVTAPSYDAMKAHLEAEGFRIFQEREEFATIKAKVPDGHPLQERTLVADFVLARRDGPSSDGRRPDYTEPGSLEDDLARRDFTVNAIAKDLDGNIIDPHGGLADIESRTLRFVGDPMDRVNEDGLRVLRGLRFMVTKGLAPDPDTWRALTSDVAAERLAGVSDQRVANELDKMLDYDTPGAVALLGQLPQPLLDAIFRDGVRLSSNRRQVKGLTRDPDLPRNPFIPVDDGEVIELGSGDAGWERVPEPPGPAVPVERDNLPPRNLDWRPPSSAALAKALSFPLGDGYRVEVDSSAATKTSAPGRIYGPRANQIGFVNWEVRTASPTAYLATIKVDPEHQGKGLGGRAYARAVDGLRALGIDTIEALALSTRGAGPTSSNGAYTWARAGFDWEPGDWSLSELGERLAAVSWDRKGEFPEADLLTARRLGRRLAAIDALPNDPEDYPEDLPTPNDIAMIGWTPGAGTWLGKEFLSGNLLPDGQDHLTWSGVMRLDPTTPDGGDAAGPVVAAVGRRAARRLLRAPDMGGGGGGAYLRSKGLWNDPGSGQFAPIGWSTAKAKDLNDRELLLDIIRDAAQSHGRVRARLNDNMLRTVGGVEKGDWVDVEFVDAGTARAFTPNGRSYDVKWRRFNDVEVPEPPRPEQPEPKVSLNVGELLDVIDDDHEGAMQNVKVLMAARSVDWDDDLGRWVETHNMTIAAEYRGYNLVVDYHASDVGGNVSWIARQDDLDPSVLTDLTGEENLNGPLASVPSIRYAFSEVAQGIDKAILGNAPPSPDTLAAEDMAPDSTNWWTRLLQDGPPGWDDTTPASPLSLEDRLAVMRYRERVTRYGDLLRDGEEPEDALRQVAVLPFDDLDPHSMPRDWRDVIEGRGYLSANLRALQGEAGFGEPDPEAIRFLQLLRQDFLAKTEQVPWRIHVDPDAPPMTGIRLYRASNNPDPYGGNDPTRFSADTPRPPSSGVTSWAFMSSDDSKRRLPVYGNIVHGLDIPFGQVIGRFGAVPGELLVAEDPALVDKIDNFDFGSPLDRALDLLDRLPPDPFAAPDLRLTATERQGLADYLQSGIDQPAAEIKRRFPELPDDDARKIALLGGVPGPEDTSPPPSTPWHSVPTWVADIPWPRLRDFAVERIFEYRGQRIEQVSDDPRIQVGARALAMLRSDVETLEADSDRVHAERMGLLASGMDWLRPTTALLGAVSQSISVPSAKQVDTELTDTDRERLDVMVGAGRILLADLRRQQDALYDDPDGERAYDPVIAEWLAARVEAADAREAEASAEARRIVEANAEEWIANLSPGTPDWPVGPLRFEPVELGLIDVKEPKFVDAEGRRFRMEGRDYDRDGVFDGWALVNLAGGGSLYPRIGGRSFWADEGERVGGVDDDALIAEALAAVETARAAWQQAQEGREELADLEVLDSELMGALSVGEALDQTRASLRSRTIGWFANVTGDRRTGGDGDGTRRVSSFSYQPEGFPDAPDMDGVRSQGDAAIAEVVDALGVQRVRVGVAELRGRRATGDTATYPLDPTDLAALGWGRGEVVVQPQPNDTVDITLQLYRSPDGPDRALPEARVTWSDRGAANSGHLAQRLGALTRRRARFEDREEAERRAVTREWAAEALNAYEPPSVKGVTPADAPRIAKLNEFATPFIPDSIKEALEPVAVKGQKPEVKDRNRSSYTGSEHRLSMADTALDSVYLHEYGHHVERLGPIGRAVWAFYQHRTPGEDPIPLGDDYEDYEVTRPDEFFARYAGKDYGDARRRSKAGRGELFTMGLEGLFYDRTSNDGQQIDDEYAAFVLGLLLHAGESAASYQPHRGRRRSGADDVAFNVPLDEGRVTLEGTEGGTDATAVAV